MHSRAETCRRLDADDGGRARGRGSGRGAGGGGELGRGGGDHAGAPQLAELEDGAQHACGTHNAQRSQRRCSVRTDCPGTCCGHRV